MFQISAMINFEGSLKHPRVKPAGLVKFCFPIFGWKGTYFAQKFRFKLIFAGYFFLNSPSSPLESNNNKV